MKRFRLNSLFLSILFAIVLFFGTVHSVVGSPLLTHPILMAQATSSSESESPQPQETNSETPQKSPTPSVQQDRSSPPESPTSKAEKNDRATTNSSYDMDAIQEFDRDIYGVK